MKKRLLNLFLALALVVLVLPMAADAASQCKHNRTASSTIKLVEAKTATCIEDGYAEHYQCTVCGKIYEPYKSSSWNEIDKPVIAKTGKHTFSVDKGYRTGDEPTCTETGVRVLGCSTPGCTATTAQEAATDPDRHTYENGVCTGCGNCKNDHKSNKIVERAKAATCSEEGARYNIYQCKTCGIYFCNNVYKETKDFPENVIPATKVHNYTEYDGWLEEPTCTEGGVKKLGCPTCNRYQSVNVEKLGHTPEVNPAVAPTCTTKGWTEGSICAVCNAPLVYRQEIAALNHEYTEDLGYRENDEPTCTEAGYRVLGCSRCDATTAQDASALGHAFEMTQTDPTCTEAGQKKYTCTREGCDAWFVVGIDALGHDYSEDLGYKEGKEPTCDKDGLRVLGCSRCDVTTVQTAYKLGHDWDISVLKEATCTIKGMEFHQCKREGCGDWKYVNIDKLGHNKVVVPAVEPTCTATGLTAGEKCDRCDKTFKAQSIVDKLPHAWKDVEAKAATCQEDGYNAHRACANCGETDGMTVIPANNTGHNYVNNRCTICREYDPAHEHQGTGTVTTDSTCTTKGVKSFSCSGCDYTWTEDIAKKAHSYGADDRCTVCQKLNSKHEHSYAQTDYREPTCDIGGQVTKQCSVCGDTTQTTINALGHSYSNGRCIRCGTAAACTHSTTNTTVTREATCKQAGQKVTSCTGCGKVMGTESIPATGNHNYVNDYCTGCGQVDPYKKTADNQDVYPLG